MNKKVAFMLAGGITAAILLIGVVILALWLTLWMPPSKEDFAAAKKDAEKIVDYNGLTQMNKFTGAVNTQYRAGKSGQALVDATNTERQTALEAVDNRARVAEQLGKSRVLRDVEVKKAYDVYAPVEASFGAYVRNYINEYPKYMTSVVSCTKAFNLSAAGKTYKQLAETHATYKKTCLEDLAILEKSPLDPYRAYAKEFKDVVNERQTVLDGVANKTMATATAVKRLTAANQKYLTIWPHEELKEYRKKQSFSGQLKKLIEILGKKEK